MNLRQLEILVKVAEAGTLSHAAFLLDIAQPVLSRQVRQLEKELQIELFHRTGRGVRLTPAGQRVLNHSQEILNSVESLKRDLNGMSRTQLTSLVVALSPTISKAIIRQLTSEVLRRYPNINLRVIEGVSGHINEWLTSGRVDIAVTYYTSSIARMNFEEICSEQLYLVAPKSGAAAPPTTKFANLKDIPLIVPGQPHGLRVLLEAMAEAAGIKLNVRIEADHFGTIKLLVEEGLGYATLPLSSIREEVKSGLFQISRVVDPELRRKLVLITSLGKIPAAGLNEIAGIIKPLVKNLSSE